MPKEKNFFELFPEYTEKEIKKAFNKLTPKSKEIIIEVFGPNLKEKANLENLTKRKREILYTIINKSLKRYLEKNNKKEIPKPRLYFKNDLISETFRKIEYKPLTKEEETTCLKKIKLSYYYTVDEKTKKLYLKYYCEVNPSFKEKYNQADEKEKQLLLKEAIEDAREERKKFIKNNERLILLIVNKINDTLSKEELFQEGNLGLMKAIERFDVEVENKFSTYAIWWIKHYINRYIINNKETIRVPSNTYSKQIKIIKATEELYSILHRKPTTQELSEKTKIPEKRIREIQLKMSTLIPQSLSERITSDDDDTLEDLIQDSNSEFETKVEEKIILENIKTIIEKLSEKNQMILSMRMGFYDGKVYTLDEVAKYFGVTREAIRQAEIKILKKIRNDLEKQSSIAGRKIIKDEIQKMQESKEESQRLRTLLLTEITQLDETTKLIIELKYKYKLSEEDIEKKFGITKREIKRREKKAFILIKERLKNNQNSKQKRK